MDAQDARTGEGRGDLALRRLEGLRFAAGPDAADALATDASVYAVGDGFDLREFRHALEDKRSDTLCAELAPRLQPVTSGRNDRSETLASMSTLPRILKNLGAILTGRLLSILQQLVLSLIHI